MEKIKVAIAGCGSRGMNTYAKCLQKFADRAELVAVADIRPDRVQVAAERYGIPPEMQFDSVESMLKVPKLADLMLICTPDDVCIRNAERTSGVMEEKGLPRPQLIVNRLDTELVRAGEMYSAATVAGVLDLPLLGEVLDDSYIYRATLMHLSPLDIDCEARSALTRIARRMMGVSEPLPGYGTKKLSWFRRLFQPTLKEVKRIDR